MGDWLREAPPAWAPPPGPVAAGPGWGPGAPVGGYWPPPPALDDDGRHRWWSWGTAAPWVVAGLLCAVLLAGRGAAPVAAPVPVEPAAPAPALAAEAVPDASCQTVAP